MDVTSPQAPVDGSGEAEEAADDATVGELQVAPFGCSCCPLRFDSIGKLGMHVRQRHSLQSEVNLAAMGFAKCPAKCCAQPFCLIASKPSRALTIVTSSSTQTKETSVDQRAKNNMPRLLRVARSWLGCVFGRL